jgi:hypothetical protein
MPTCLRILRAGRGPFLDEPVALKAGALADRNP